MNLADIFETFHGSKWTVSKLLEDGFEATSSDSIRHRFTSEGKFVRDDYSELHPYDFRRPWSEREKEDAEKIKAELEAARLKESDNQKSSEELIEAPKPKIILKKNFRR